MINLIFMLVFLLIFVFYAKEVFTLMKGPKNSETLISAITITLFYAIITLAFMFLSNYIGVNL